MANSISCCLQEDILPAVTHRPPSPTTGHVVELHQEPRDPGILFNPWLLPHLNRCLSLETSKCYHRQYSISPYNILSHSAEPRRFINVRAKANMLCALLEFHKCLRSGWGGFGPWNRESGGGWGGGVSEAALLFRSRPQTNFFCFSSVALGRTTELIF